MAEATEVAVCAEENDTLPYFNCDFYFEPPEVSIHTGTFVKYRSIFILRLWKRFVAKTRVFFPTGMTKKPNNFCLFVCLSFPFLFAVVNLLNHYDRRYSPNSLNSMNSNYPHEQQQHYTPLF